MLLLPLCPADTLFSIRLLFVVSVVYVTNKMRFDFIWFIVRLSTDRQTGQTTVR